jgi:hypothetical protein
LEEDDAKHLQVKCPETKKWTEEFVCSKWLEMNEDMECRLIISCTDVAETETTGKYSFKTKCKWETKVRGDKPLPQELAGS